METLLAWFDSYPTLKGYTGIFAGALAFIGVIFALCGNALLQWWDRESNKNHEREVIRSALAAELAHLHVSYENRIEKMEEALDGFDVPVHVPTQVYDKMLDRIGLFSPKQANAVIHAYLAAKHLPMNLRRLALETAMLQAPKITDDYIEVAKFNMDKAIKLHRDRLALVAEALKLLTKGQPAPKDR